jgi:hypothetical protein
MYQDSKRLRARDKRKLVRSIDSRDYFFIPGILRKLAKAPTVEEELVSSANMINEETYALEEKGMDMLNSYLLTTLTADQREFYFGDPQPFVQPEDRLPILMEMRQWVKSKRIKEYVKIVPASAAEWEEAIRKAGGQVVKS